LKRLKLQTSNFTHGLATRSTNLQMTKCLLSVRGQGHVTPSSISHSWNISGMAETRVFKYCVVAGYVKC